MNKSILIGRLGQDPEVTYLPSGTAMAKFSVATTERYTKDGERQEQTEWHRIVVFGKLAEVCGEYLSKGKQACIIGRIQTRDWEDKKGIKRWSTEIIANEVEFLDGTKEPKPNKPTQEDDGIPF